VRGAGGGGWAGVGTVDGAGPGDGDGDVVCDGDGDVVCDGDVLGDGDGVQAARATSATARREVRRNMTAT